MHDTFHVVEHGGSSTVGHFLDQFARLFVASIVFVVTWHCEPLHKVLLVQLAATGNAIEASRDIGEFIVRKAHEATIGRADSE